MSGREGWRGRERMIEEEWELCLRERERVMERGINKRMDGGTQIHQKNTHAYR